jgi:hypothetical protein
VQVAPIKPTLKPPGSKHLKVKCDELLSGFAFKFILRSYIVVDPETFQIVPEGTVGKAALRVTIYGGSISRMSMNPIILSA